MAQVESWKNKNIDGFYMITTQKGGFSKLCVKIKKRCYTDLFHFSTHKHNLVYFFGKKTNPPPPPFKLNGRSLINIQNCCIKALNCKHAFIRYNSNLTYLYDYITIHGGSHENYLVQLKTVWEIIRCTCIV
jgi:hypothetical protein